MSAPAKSQIWAAVKAEGSSPRRPLGDSLYLWLRKDTCILQNVRDDTSVEELWQGLIGSEEELARLVARIDPYRRIPRDLRSSDITGFTFDVSGVLLAMVGGLRLEFSPQLDTPDARSPSHATFVHELLSDSWYGALESALQAFRLYEGAYRGFIRATPEEPGSHTFYYALGLLESRTSLTAELTKALVDREGPIKILRWTEKHGLSQFLHLDSMEIFLAHLPSLKHYGLLQVLVNLGFRRPALVAELQGFIDDLTQPRPRSGLTVWDHLDE